jgi:hypothetical protein
MICTWGAHGDSHGPLLQRRVWVRLSLLCGVRVYVQRDRGPAGGLACLKVVIRGCSGPSGWVMGVFCVDVHIILLDANSLGPPGTSIGVAPGTCCICNAALSSANEGLPQQSWVASAAQHIPHLLHDLSGRNRGLPNREGMGAWCALLSTLVHHRTHAHNQLL